MSRIPKSFLSISVSRFMPIIENTHAEIVPPRIAGKMLFNCTAPCRQRKNPAIKAQGIKNNKLRVRADNGSIFKTSVRYRIRRLPPPTPRPDRNPSTAATISVILTQITYTSPENQNTQNPMKPGYTDSFSEITDGNAAQGAAKQIGKDTICI